MAQIVPSPQLDQTDPRTVQGLPGIVGDSTVKVLALLILSTRPRSFSSWLPLPWANHWHFSFLLGDDDVHVLFFLLFFLERRLLESSFIFFSSIWHHQLSLSSSSSSTSSSSRTAHHMSSIHSPLSSHSACPVYHLSRYVYFMQIYDDCHGQAPSDGPSKPQPTTSTSDGLMDDHQI